MFENHICPSMMTAQRYQASAVQHIVDLSHITISGREKEQKNTDFGTMPYLRLTFNLHLLFYLSQILQPTAQLLYLPDKILCIVECQEISSLYC